MPEVNHCLATLKWLFTKVEEPYHIILQNLYYLNSIYMLEAGDYETALDYINHAIRIGDQEIRSRVPLDQMLFYKAEIVEMTGNIDSARVLYEKVMENYDRYSPEYMSFYGCNYANFLLLTGQSAQARIIADRALNTAVRELGAISNYTAMLYHMLSNIKVIEGDTTGALNSLRQSINIYHGFYGERYYDLSSPYINMAEIFANLGLLDSAKIYAQYALISSSLAFNNTDPAITPTAKDLMPLESSLQALKWKAIIFIKAYTQSHNTKDLIPAYESCMTMFELIDTMRSLLPFMDSKLYFSDRFGDVYKRAMFCAAELYKHSHDRYYLEQAWYISELSKASLLIESMNELPAQIEGGIPAETSNEISLLLTKISTYKRFLFEETKKEVIDAGKVSEINRQLFDARKDYRRLMSDIRQNHPKYFEFKTEKKISTLKEVARSLQRGKALVSYFDGDSILYSFIITKDKTELITQTLEESLDQKVIAFRNILESPHFSTRANEVYQQFISLSSSLYRILVAPVKPYFKNKSLIIIPDGILGHLPFGLLVDAEEITATTKRANYQALPYLIKTNPISYGISSTLLLKKQSSGLHHSNKILAVAPDYSTYNDPEAPQYNVHSFTPLSQAQEEASQAEKTFGGELLQGEMATKRNFLANLNGYGILHIASHSTLSDDSPLDNRITFSCDTGAMGCDLYVHELFNIKIDARMAILSGCNTAMGTYHRGEGIMSLSRGFLFAGCNSTVVSLWQVPDRGGKELIMGFYKYLRKGLTKDEAIQKAQIDYLESASELNSFPARWGMFVVIGDASPIARSQDSKALLICLFVIFVLGAAYYIIRRYRKQHA